MKGIKKLVALAVGVVMSTTLLAGCSTEGMALYNAMSKTNTVKSVETQTDIGFKLSAKNMSPQEEIAMKEVLPAINDSKISLNMKTKGNEDQTAAKAQASMKAQFGGKPFNMDFWVDVDMNGDKPILKEIFTMPKEFMVNLPKDIANKKYMVMDFSDMESTSQMVGMDYNKIIQFSKDFQPKIQAFMANYVKQYNPKYKVISKVGQEYLKSTGSVELVDVYELKLDDATFKALLKYTVNNLAENKEVFTFLKEYTLATMALTDLPEDQLNAVKQQLDQSFEVVQQQIPMIMPQVNKMLEALNAVKIVGDNGIKIKYLIDSQGYIVKEEGNIELVADMPAINKLLGNNSPMKELTGIYTIGVEYSNSSKNINKDILISFPQLNKNNSFNYSELFKLEQGLETKK